MRETRREMEVDRGQQKGSGGIYIPRVEGGIWRCEGKKGWKSVRIGASKKGEVVQAKPRVGGEIWDARVENENERGGRRQKR